MVYLVTDIISVYRKPLDGLIYTQSLVTIRIKGVVQRTGDLVLACASWRTTESIAFETTLIHVIGRRH